MKATQNNRIYLNELLDDDLLEKRRIIERIIEVVPSHYIRAEIAKTVKEIKEFEKNYSLNDKGLYIYGGVGSGKTYSAYAILKEMIINNIDVEASKSTQLLASLRPGGEHSNDQTYNNRLSEVDVLLIDDLGLEKQSDWVTETLFNIIDTRLENQKTTIFTSNYSLSELEGKMDDRLLSRIYDMTIQLEHNGKDKRVNK